MYIVELTTICLSNAHYLTTRALVIKFHHNGPRTMINRRYTMVMHLAISQLERIIYIGLTFALNGADLADVCLGKRPGGTVSAAALDLRHVHGSWARALTPLKHAVAAATSGVCK